METRLRINEILSLKGITLKELADELNVEYSNLYTSINSNTTLDTLKKISAKLKIPLKDLIDSGGDKSFQFHLSVFDGHKEKLYFINSFIEMNKKLPALIRKYNLEREIEMNTTDLKIRFYEILKSNDISMNLFSDKSGIKKTNINNYLIGNPTINTLSKIATGLDVSVKELFGPLSKNTVTINGLFQYQNDFVKINSGLDLVLFWDSFKNKFKHQLLEISEVVRIITKDFIQPLFNQNPFELNDIILDEHTIDASKIECINFRNKGDINYTNNIVLNFGNMPNVFPFKFKKFCVKNSEVCYISGVYSLNSKEHTKIQSDILQMVNGLKAKRLFRRDKFSYLKRTDFELFNIEWMKYIILCKVNGNLDFYKLLKSVPENTLIIEDTSFQKIKASPKKLIWGMENIELWKTKKEYEKKLIQTLNETNQLKYKDKYIKELYNILNEFGLGQWHGKNLMGQILTHFKYCIHNKLQPNINWDILKARNIYLCGELLDFNDNELRFIE